MVGITPTLVLTGRNIRVGHRRSLRSSYHDFRNTSYSHSGPSSRVNDETYPSFADVSHKLLRSVAPARLKGGSGHVDNLRNNLNFLLPEKRRNMTYLDTTPV